MKWRFRLRQGYGVTRSRIRAAARKTGAVGPVGPVGHMSMRRCWNYHKRRYAAPLQNYRSHPPPAYAAYASNLSETGVFVGVLGIVGAWGVSGSAVGNVCDHRGSRLCSPPINSQSSQDSQSSQGSQEGGLFSVGRLRVRQRCPRPRIQKNRPLARSGWCAMSVSGLGPRCVRGTGGYSSNARLSATFEPLNP